jgi:hypothetical protein
LTAPTLLLGWLGLVRRRLVVGLHGGFDGIRPIPVLGLDEFHQFGVALGGAGLRDAVQGEDQGVETGVGGRADVGTAIQQCGNDIPPAVGGGDVQGVLAQLVLDLDLGSLGDQGLDGIHMPIAGREHQRGDPLVVLPVDVGPTGDQDGEDVHLAVHGRHVQRGLTVLRGFDGFPVVQQILDGLGFVLDDGLDHLLADGDVLLVLFLAIAGTQNQDRPRQYGASQRTTLHALSFPPGSRMYESNLRL